MIYDMYLSGIGVTKIQYELEKAGRLTATGKEKWFASYISHMLRNSFYCGIITYHKEYTPDYLKQKKIKNDEYTDFDGLVIPESIVEAFIQKIWVSKDEFRWYLRTNRSSSAEDAEHIQIGAFTLTLEDAKSYQYSFSTRKRIYNWEDLNVTVWI